MGSSRTKREATGDRNRLAPEAHYRVLRTLEANPNFSQRQLAEELGISVGKANYCIKALIDRGWVKARNLRNSSNKLSYAYVLTPKGIRRKAQLTMRFLEIKQREFEALKREISALSNELDGENKKFP